MVVLHTLSPAPVGGLERVVQTLVTGLQANGVEVHVAPVLTDCTDATHPFVAALNACGVPVHPIHVRGRGYRQERSQLAVLCRSIRPDIVHTHGYRSDLIAPPVARRAGAAVVTTVHGFTGGGVRNRLYEAIQRRSFKSFDAVIAVSRALHDELASAGVSLPGLRLIQNAAPPPREALHRAAARERLGISNAAFHIGWVGRLSREKGPDVLLEACRSLPSDVEVTFVGDGPEARNLVDRSAALDLGQRVHWAGTQVNAALLFSAFDVFVLSSRTEGTPMVLFEALSARVPIVATRVGGVPDVLDETCAWLVESDRPAQIADAISTIRSLNGAARARVEAGARILDRFNAERWVGQHEALYRQLRF
jgi:glycosyltransferase involved in cell wall biosynthesis